MPSATQVFKQIPIPYRHLLFLLIFLVAVFFRFWNLAVAPYYEWDEPVYTSIGANVARTGDIRVKTEIGAVEPVYLYHPPFHFLLLGGWFERFGMSIEIARILAAAMSTVTLAILFFFLIAYDRGRDGGALIALFLLGIDSWMVFSNRVGWIENTMMPIGIMGLWVYDSALKAETTQYWRFALAGALLSAVSIYKHVGLYFLLMVPICWVINGRKDIKAHALLAATAGGLIFAYIFAMVTIYGDFFIDHYTVQIRRTFGLQHSRGVVESFNHLITAITGNYRIYAGMMITALIAFGFFIGKIYLAIRHRTLAVLQDNAVLFSCTAASLVFFGSISLKIPHYYLMVLVPLYAFAAMETVGLVRRNPIHRKMISAVLSLIFLINVFALFDLFGSAQQNAGADLKRYFDASEPINAAVITEETIGTLIRQPYFKIGRFQRHLYNGDFRKHRPSLLVTYESITQKIPDNPELALLIDKSTVIQEFSDFKCRLKVYRIPEGLWSTDELKLQNLQSE
ncbi:MAG: hypothetical protein PVH30_14270 [Desulfobacterales bacterium]|jgi:4-amino-4-deoxy-L-arabinose transferase-like glycosyltransferase